MKTTELLDLQTNANANNNSESNGKEELIKQERIEDTPFTFVKEHDNPGFIALGIYKVSDAMFNTIEEAYDFLMMLDGLNWNFILNVFSVFGITFANAKEDEFIENAETDITVKK